MRQKEIFYTLAMLLCIFGAGGALFVAFPLQWLSLWVALGIFVGLLLLAGAFFILGSRASPCTCSPEMLMFAMDSYNSSCPVHGADAHR